MAELNEATGDMIHRLVEQYIDESTGTVYMALVTEPEPERNEMDEEGFTLEDILNLLMPDPTRRRVSERMAGIAYLIQCVSTAAQYARESLPEDENEDITNNVATNAARSFEALGVSQSEMDLALKMIDRMDAKKDEMHWSPDADKG